MRAVILAAVVMALGACATHRVPAAAIPAQPPSSDWSTVRALPKGTFILLTLDEDQDARRAFVSHATDTALTVYEAAGTNTIPRGRVARISVQDQIGTRRAPRYISIPIASAIVGGLAGILVGAVARNREVMQASAWTFGIGMMVGVAAGPMDYPRAIMAERPVYVRP